MENMESRYMLTKVNCSRRLGNYRGRCGQREFKIIRLLSSLVIIGLSKRYPPSD